MNKFNMHQNNKDALECICAIAIDYDGYNTCSAKQMKGLVDDLVDVASRALKGKPVYLRCKCRKPGGCNEHNVSGRKK